MTSSEKWPFLKTGPHKRDAITTRYTEMYLFNREHVEKISALDPNLKQTITRVYGREEQALTSQRCNYYNFLDVITHLLKTSKLKPITLAALITYLIIIK